MLHQNVDWYVVTAYPGRGWWVERGGGWKEVKGMGSWIVEGSGVEWNGVEWSDF